MRKAYQSLKNKGTTISDDPITTTHYYVRFFPSDSIQYDALKNDTTIDVYPYPLDYEMGGESDDYFDSESNDPTYQYAAVPIGYTFDPSIQHDVLEELYIPEEEYGDEWDEYEYYSVSASGSKSKLTFLQQLVNQSMKLTGNEKDTIKTSKGAKTKFEPSGTIRVYDTRLQQLIPLVGVHVRARHWFRTKTTSTDDYGNYSLPNFRNPVNYSIVYETNRFDIRSGKYGQAWRNGPKQNYAWNVDIYDGVQRFYAHVFRGARRFFYGNTGGLRRPNTTFGKLKYAAINGWDSRQNLAGKNRIVFQGGIMPDIKIWRNSADSYNREFGSDEVFSTTVHETAHTTHAQTMNGLIQFAQVSSFIAESWPTAVEWQVTQMEYRERGISDYSGPYYTAIIPGTNYVSIFPARYGYQNWTPALSSAYGSVFIDIVDNFNQGGGPSGLKSYTGICDNVTGYTLAGIESSFLKHVYVLTVLEMN